MWSRWLTKLGESSVANALSLTQATGPWQVGWRFGQRQMFFLCQLSKTVSTWLASSTSLSNTSATTFKTPQWSSASLLDAAVNSPVSTNLFLSSSRPQSQLSWNALKTHLKRKRIEWSALTSFVVNALSMAGWKTFSKNWNLQMQKVSQVSRGPDCQYKWTSKSRLWLQ